MKVASMSKAATDFPLNSPGLKSRFLLSRHQITTCFSCILICIFTMHQCVRRNCTRISFSPVWPFSFIATFHHQQATNERRKTRKERNRFFCCCCCLFVVSSKLRSPGLTQQFISSSSSSGHLSGRDPVTGEKDSRPSPSFLFFFLW